MADGTNPRVSIVGAGLGGALMAAYLGQAGFPVEVYERRPDPRVGPVAGGRSINLAISVRGIHALREVGVADEVLRMAVPMRGRMIHGLGGELTFQPYGVCDEECINSVSRAGLNLALVSAAEHCPNVRMHFDHRCTGIDLETGAVELCNGSSGEALRAEGDLVIGGDGAFSAVRASMQRLDRFDYSQDYLEHGYKELSIPAKPGGGFMLEPNALHIWPRRSFMMIALPNIDGSFTCTLFFPHEGPESFAALRTEADVLRFYEATFPDAVPLMPTLCEDFFGNPTGSLVTVRCGPWHYRGKVVLMGDAAHAVVPFYGQGANAAFEDCTVLNQCLRDHGSDWGRAFERFYALRKPDADALADLAIANFIEMRDHTGSKVFLMKKKAEKLLHRLFPHWYVPLYTLVSFTRTPYAEAVHQARVQNRVVLDLVISLLISLAVLLALVMYLT